MNDECGVILEPPCCEIVRLSIIIDDKNNNNNNRKKQRITEESNRLPGSMSCPAPNDSNIP